MKTWQKGFVEYWEIRQFIHSVFPADTNNHHLMAVINALRNICFDFAVPQFTQQEDNLLEAARVCQHSLEFERAQSNYHLENIHFLLRHFLCFEKRTDGLRNYTQVPWGAVKQDFERIICERSVIEDATLSFGSKRQFVLHARG